MNRAMLRILRHLGAGELAPGFWQELRISSRGLVCHLEMDSRPRMLFVVHGSAAIAGRTVRQGEMMIVPALREYLLQAEGDDYLHAMICPLDPASMRYCPSSNLRGMVHLLAGKKNLDTASLGKRIAHLLSAFQSASAEAGISDVKLHAPRRNKLLCHIHKALYPREISKILL